MGCDIHVVIEFDKYGHDIWDSFSDGEIHIDRDYEIFSAIAFGDGGYTADLPFPPRGIPANYSSVVRESFFEPIDIDDTEISEPQFEAAIKEEWLRKAYREDKLWLQEMLHTPSWLYKKELDIALEHAQIKLDSGSPTFRAMYSVLKILSEAYGNERVRMVFWFDN